MVVFKFFFRKVKIFEFVIPNRNSKFENFTLSRMEVWNQPLWILLSRFFNFLDKVWRYPIFQIRHNFGHFPFVLFNFSCVKFWIFLFFFLVRYPRVSQPLTLNWRMHIFWLLKTLTGRDAWQLSSSRRLREEIKENILHFRIQLGDP